MSSVSTSIAPLNGVLRYPRDTLITLVRSILKVNQEHHKALRKAADAKGDEDETENQTDILSDIDRLVVNLDSARWKADYEKIDPDRVWDAEALRDFADPKGAEKALFNMEVGQHKVEWVSDGTSNKGSNEPIFAGHQLLCQIPQRESWPTSC